MRIVKAHLPVTVRNILQGKRKACSAPSNAKTIAGKPVILTSSVLARASAKRLTVILSSYSGIDCTESKRG